MPKITVGAAPLNQLPLDFEGNRSRIVDAVKAARISGVELLCLPELCISGYGCEDAFFFPDVRERSLDALNQIIPETRDIAVSVGLPLELDGKLFNAAALISDGALLGFVLKKHLADEGIHYEPRWFSPWPVGRETVATVNGSKIPAGDLIFNLGGVGIGFEICEDAWVKERPASALAARGAHVILNPSASHFAMGKHAVRRALVERGSSLSNGVYVFTNHLGNEAGRAIYDGDALIAQNGKIVAESSRFAFGNFSLIAATLEVPGAGSGSPTSEIAAGKAWRGKGSTVTARAAWENSKDLRFEEFTRAISLGLYDYLRKSKANGFVLSLSGGADSGSITALVDYLCRRLRTERDFNDVKKELPQVSAKNAEEFTRSILTCVYQSLPNSSATTLRSAREVAEGAGAEFIELKLSEVLEGYTQLGIAALGRKLSWKEDDLTLQNLQARVRSPSIWLVANVRGALLLTTANRSEAAVGYCTMDGDTSGSLAPIAGIDKHFIREWLRWAEKSGPEGLGNAPYLKTVNSLEPTAELRPAEMQQTDEKDLMPYEVLAFLERAFLKERKGPTELAALLEEKFSAYSMNEREDFVARFLALWARSQWKRERFAPAFHLDTFSVDPKTWCRFPILSKPLD